MEVFLIPVEAERYELYCEVPDDEVTAGDPPRGMIGGLVHRFRAALAEAERERHRPAPEPHEHDEPQSWYTRVKRRLMRRVAESITEQRLLWHMRRQTEAVAVHPEDLPADRAMGVVRASMQSDFDRHRYWLVVDSLLFAASGLFVLLPGPNVVAYYFGFRLVGHYLSMRGARQSLRAVAWTTRASAPLTELRATIGLDPEEREARVHDIAARLRLERLATFFQRTAVPGA